MPNTSGTGPSIPLALSISNGQFTIPEGFNVEFDMTAGTFCVDSGTVSPQVFHYSNSSGGAADGACPAG